MNEFNNTPIEQDMPKGAAGWISTWIKAVTKPTEQTFIEISESADAQPKTAYLWIFIFATLAYFVSSLTQVIAQVIANGGLSGDSSSASFLTVCLAPVIGGVAILFFALGTAIIQWIAQLFGGTGSYAKLIYPMAAIYVPIALISTLLAPFNAIPFISICTGGISILASLYSLFLNITAVKAVNRFGWGQAAGSVLIPGFVILFVCGCVVIGGLMLMGPMINDIFNQINQSLQTAP